MKRLVIADFYRLRPRFEATQSEALEWLAAVHAKASGESEQNMLKKLHRFGCKPDAIAKRGHYLEDFTHRNWDRMNLFNLENSSSGAAVKARSDVFSQVVDQAFREVLGGVSVPPKHLIHVTCTGYVAPSGAQKVVSEKGWGDLTTVTHAYHMGCYAAIPALRMGWGFLATNKSTLTVSDRADVVHTELCTLHFNPNRHEPEQLVVQSLFADGIIKYSLFLVPEEELQTSSWQDALECVHVKEEILPQSQQAMTWQYGDFGLEMTLSRDVPLKIGEAIERFVRDLFQEVQLCYEKEKQNVLFAIHPGGPRIIQQLQEILGLTDEQVVLSKRVLFEHGNMSSATLPHVWQLASEEREACISGRYIVSLAFGPGLTVCGALLRKV